MYFWFFCEGWEDCPCARWSKIEGVRRINWTRTTATQERKWLEAWVDWVGDLGKQAAERKIRETVTRKRWRSSKVERRTRKGIEADWGNAK